MTYVVVCVTRSVCARYVPTASFRAYRFVRVSVLATRCGSEIHFLASTQSSASRLHQSAATFLARSRERDQPGDAAARRRNGAEVGTPAPWHGDKVWLISKHGPGLKSGKKLGFASKLGCCNGWDVCYTGVPWLVTACVSQVEPCRFRAAKCLGGRSAEFESRIFGCGL